MLPIWELLTFFISINLYWDLAFHLSVNVSTAQSSINSIYNFATVEEILIFFLHNEVIFTLWLSFTPIVALNNMKIVPITRQHKLLYLHS